MIFKLQQRKQENLMILKSKLPQEEDTEKRLYGKSVLFYSIV